MADGIRWIMRTRRRCLFCIRLQQAAGHNNLSSPDDTPIPLKSCCIDWNI